MTKQRFIRFVGIFLALAVTSSAAYLYAAHRRVFVGGACGASVDDRLVFYFAEGNVWRGAYYRDTWALLYNPTGTAQTVSVILHVDNEYFAEYGQAYVVPARQRLPVNLADITARILPSPGDNINFGVTVIFDRAQGAAALASWDRAYAHPTPIPGVQACDSSGVHGPY